MKVELELMKSKLEYPESNRDMQDAVSKYVEVDFETEDSDINRSFNDNEESNQITFIQGNKGAKNPGKLVFGNNNNLFSLIPVQSAKTNNNCD